MRGRRRHRLRRPAVASDGRDHPRALRFRRHPCLPPEQPVGRRAHGGGRGRRLWPRHAGAGLRHRPPVPAADKQTPLGEQIVEYMLYMLWDMGLKVGHATRNIDECVRLSRSDITIRTSILEARFVWADEALFDELIVRFDKEVVKGTGAGICPGQARRARRAPRQGRRKPLSRRAQRQGRQGRPARPADAVLDRQVFLSRAHAARNWSTRACSPAPNTTSS